MASIMKRFSLVIVVSLLNRYPSVDGKENIIANPSKIMVTSGFLQSSPLGKAIIIGGITDKYRNMR